VAWGPLEQAGLAQRVAWPLGLAAQNWHTCLWESGLKSRIQGTARPHCHIPGTFWRAFQSFRLRELYHNSG